MDINILELWRLQRTVLALNRTWETQSCLKFQHRYLTEMEIFETWLSSKYGTFIISKTCLLSKPASTSYKSICEHMWSRAYVKPWVWLLALHGSRSTDSCGLVVLNTTKCGSCKNQNSQQNEKKKQKTSFIFFFFSEDIKRRHSKLLNSVSALVGRIS